MAVQNQVVDTAQTISSDDDYKSAMNERLSKLRSLMAEQKAQLLTQKPASKRKKKRS